MPFALIPEGFKLQQVTKLQQEAVDKYNSSQSTQAFLEAEAPAEMVKAVAIVVTPIVLAVLAKRGYEFAEDEVKDILSTITRGVGGFGEDLLERTIAAINQISPLRSF